MSQEKFYIPRHLDDAPKFLLWDIDDAISFITPLFFCFMIGKGLLGVLLAATSFHVWRKTKRLGGKNLIRCLIYWYYPRSVLGLKSTPESSIRNYLG